MEIIIQLGFVLFFIVLGLTVGTYRERRHFRHLAEREAQSQDIGVVNLRHVTSPETVCGATLVIGQAVIATDYFKTFIAGWKKLIGGELRTYERLMERARREALLRALDQAREFGATELWNVRYQSSNILSGGRKRYAVSVEVVAYGTAIKRKSAEHDVA